MQKIYIYIYIISSMSSLQTLVIDTIPKTAMIVGTTAQTTASIK